MSDTPAIRLKRGEGRAFKAGGPWIYDNEIAEILGEPADGGIVRIEDYNGYPLGVGFLNRASTIAVRVLSRDAGAVTAFAYASDEQQVMENGFDAYMAKPINANQLRTQISAILKQHIIFM